MKKFWKELESKNATAGFSVVAFIAGVLFLKKAWEITGNVVLNNRYSLDLIPLIGLLLVLCSIILGTYSLRKNS